MIALKISGVSTIMHVLIAHLLKMHTFTISDLVQPAHVIAIVVEEARKPIPQRLIMVSEAQQEVIVKPLHRMGNKSRHYRDATPVDFHKRT